jgi:hypothetical protein
MSSVLVYASSAQASGSPAAVAMARIHAASVMPELVRTTICRVCGYERLVPSPFVGGCGLPCV